MHICHAQKKKIKVKDYKGNAKSNKLAPAIQAFYSSLLLVHNISAGLFSYVAFVCTNR